MRDPRRKRTPWKDQQTKNEYGLDLSLHSDVADGQLGLYVVWQNLERGLSLSMFPAYASCSPNLAASSGLSEK